MGFWRKLGKLALKAAPVAASFIPGVGPLAAAGIGAAAGALGNGKPKLSNVLGGAAAGAGGALAKGAVSGGGGLGGLVGRAGDALDKIGGVDTLLGAASAYQGYQADKNADKYRKMALDQANARWAAGQPLRDAGMRDLMSEETPDLSSLYEASQNPFRRVRRPTGGMA